MKKIKIKIKIHKREIRKPKDVKSQKVIKVSQSIFCCLLLPFENIL